MRKVNIADLVKLPHAPKNLIAVVKKIAKSKTEYWVHEWGNKHCGMLPSFWSKNTETGKKKELMIGSSAKPYPTLSIGKVRFDCHRLVALAFVKNYDPKNNTSVDHVANPNDADLVLSTKLIWVELKRAFKNRVCLLQPHFCNFKPDALEWVSNGENSARAKTQEHKDYQEKIKNYGKYEAMQQLIEAEKEGKLKNYFDFGHPLLREYCPYASAAKAFEDYKKEPFQMLERMAEALVNWHDESHHEQAIEYAIDYSDHLKVAEMGEYNYIKEAIRTRGESVGQHHPQQGWLRVLTDKLEAHFGMPVDSFSKGEWDSIVDFIWKCCEDYNRVWHPEEFNDLDFGYFVIQLANNPELVPHPFLGHEDLDPSFSLEPSKENAARMIAENFSFIRKDVFDDERLVLLTKEESREFKP